MYANNRDIYITNIHSANDYVCIKSERKDIHNQGVKC